MEIDAPFDEFSRYLSVLYNSREAYVIFTFLPGASVVQ